LINSTLVIDSRVEFVVYCKPNSQKMNFRYLFTFLLFMCFSDIVHSQRVVTGKVMDILTKKEIENVDVTIYKGTATTSTNNRGYFQLNLEEGDSLLFAHPEYQLGLIAAPDAAIFTVYLEGVDDYPVYLPGEAVLYKFLQEHIQYPNKALFKGVEGIAVIMMTIDSDGNMITCKALNELEGNCTREAVKVFLQIPGKWSAGAESKNLLFPVVFRIGKTKDDIEIPDFDVVKGKFMDPVYVTGTSGG